MDAEVHYRDRRVPGAENGPVYRVEDRGGSPALGRFELRVLAQPAHKVDVSTLQDAVDSLRADIDTILEARVSESCGPFCRAC